MIEHPSAGALPTESDEAGREPVEAGRAAWSRGRNHKLLRTALDHCSLFGLTTGLRLLEIGPGVDELRSLFESTLPDCDYHLTPDDPATLALPPLGGPSFDVVLLNGIGYRAEIGTILREARARLLPGGIVIVSDVIHVDASHVAGSGVSSDAVGQILESRYGLWKTIAFDEMPARAKGEGGSRPAVHVRAVLANEAQEQLFAFAADDLSFVMDLPFGRALATGAPFGIVRGKWNLIIGRSGSGKTSLLRALQGDLAPYARKARGFPSDRYFYMPQNVDVFENLTPVQNVRAYGGGRAAALSYFDELGMVDFHKRKHASDISGGERQRLLVAQIMAADPELVMLDEPSKGLDRAGRLVVFDALADRFARADLDGGATTLVCADHDFAAIYRRFDYVFEIRDGRQILVWSK